MNREGHAVALITGDSTTDQRVAVLNRYSDEKKWGRGREREGRERGGGVREREGGEKGEWGEGADSGEERVERCRD